MGSSTTTATVAAAETHAKGHAAANATDAAAITGPKEVNREDDIRFAALQSAYYHGMRYGQLEAVHRVLLFFTVIGGTTALAGVVASLPWLAGVAAVLPTMAGTFDLVGDFAGRAALHKGLQAKFIDIIARLNVPNGEDPIAALRVDLQRAYAEEPPIKRVVQALATNAAIRSLGRDPNAMFVVSWPRYISGSLLSFEGYDPATRSEVAASHASTSKM